MFFFRTHPNARAPYKGSAEAVGWDVKSIQDIDIPPHSRMLIGTGLAVDPPKWTYIQVAPRSGLALKGIDVAAGVIDPDYTGEIKVLLVNMTSKPFEVRTGDCVAQLICERYAPGIISEADSSLAKQTIRGAKGFGSSGR
ncbi:dUTP diphosphatase [Laetiporus sulphureus 93-53]|uniref:Deoxyuridine 5'-triphosphate nucleotidohydrolase n=1 Tax=Laetiporus sulphureus 93-53 TaxID=1314785 RepID=A0A165D3P0_9APHY|nr:dUTP diphosphatase [Laetiporus sulphureus 93-53]KZT04096.1 dUTP diphosphatase [Laetiporus sulphureus 93-53]